MFQMLALDNIHAAPAARKIPRLELLIPSLIAWLSRDMIEGWLYKRGKDGVLLPWLVHSMRHVQPAEGAAYVIIGLLANTVQAAGREPVTDPRLRRTGMTYGISFYADDIVDRTIPELTADDGFFKECAEFKAEYESHAKRFMQLQPRYGAQVTVSGSAWMMGAGPRPQLEYARLPGGTSARCVNDEELLERQFDTTADASFWCEKGIGEGFERVPLHCYLRLDQALVEVASRFPIDPTRLGFAGFSDGGSYALSAGMTNGDVASHVMVFSGGFMSVFQQNGAPRIFIAHGLQDEQLPIETSAHQHVAKLKAAGYDVTAVEFMGSHRIEPPVVTLAMDFFLGSLALPGQK